MAKHVVLETLCVSTFLNLLYSFHFLNEDEKSSEKPKTKNGEPLGLVPNMSPHLSRILPSNASLFYQNLLKLKEASDNDENDLRCFS